MCAKISEEMLESKLELEIAGWTVGFHPPFMSYTTTSGLQSSNMPVCTLKRINMPVCTLQRIVEVWVGRGETEEDAFWDAYLRMKLYDLGDLCSGVGQ